MAKTQQIVSDAIVVGEEWISEHFFTSDGTKETFQALVLERRKEWDAAEKEGALTPLKRLTKQRAELEVRLGSLYPSGEDDPINLESESREVYATLLDILGYTNSGLVLEQHGPIQYAYQSGMSAGGALAIISAKPAQTPEEIISKKTTNAAGESVEAETLFEPFALHEDDDPVTSVSRLLSALFVQPESDAPKYALVFAGRIAVIAERERWAEGRYLSVDLQAVVERGDTRKGGEIDRALVCLSAQSLAPQLDGSIWWDTALDASVKHTVGVSQDLRDGVRLSIEIIGNEVVSRRSLKGLDPLPADQAQPLAKQALRYLYRILFLLYSEASPELGVLPTGAPEYEAGYSLDRLRDMCQVELTNPKSQHGSHLYESLQVLFELVGGMRSNESPANAADTINAGVSEAASNAPSEVESESSFSQELQFHDLRADLFTPQATELIDQVGLGNAAMQQVLRHLLLSKAAKGKDRGFISYAELGINQLGAVYEGLMSYTGFFAEDDLYEVAKDGDASKGSWVVPVSRADGISAKDFVLLTDEHTGERSPVIHQRGSFVFRLAGRERQQSASYYTPEVLTKFTVSQALEELLDQDGVKTPARDILNMTVCEPALGSGAFAIEATRQLAEQYLRRRQEETGERIDPDSYPIELQKVKAYIALHQVYGVDLNATAVELAEISLWLDTMVAGLQAPWFGLHLRRGNSLIGSRRAAFSRAEVDKKAHLSQTPTDYSVASLAQEMREDRVGNSTSGKIFHFLLPHEGWGAAADSKEAKNLAPTEAAALKAWRNSIKAKLSKPQAEKLVNLSRRVEVLWQFTLRRLQVAESEIRRNIHVWGYNDSSASMLDHRSVEREQVEQYLNDANGAYLRLRRVMDAWNALWFWPLVGVREGSDGQPIKPPSIDEWIDGLTAILGVHSELKVSGRYNKGQSETFASVSTWDELAQAEELDLSFAGALDMSKVLDQNEWLTVTQGVAANQGFFHWELDFVTVFARGGFDLQVGNPPWVRPRSDVDALMAEGDPWWQLANKPTQAQRAQKRDEALQDENLKELVVNGTADVGVTAAFVGSAVSYPYLVGLQPDLYRCFMEQTWRNSSVRGMAALIHPESHFNDDKAEAFRVAVYLRLRRHWQFVNELSIFEIAHLFRFGVHVYGRKYDTPKFLHATSLYHPDTVSRSLAHDGSGKPPSFKTETGAWDLSPHKQRVSTVGADTIQAWGALIGTAQNPLGASMVFLPNQTLETIVEKLADNSRVQALGPSYSRGWDESIDRAKGVFESKWGAPSSVSKVIYQGPNLHVGNPFYKSPNQSMRNHLDWSSVDLETIPESAVPYTQYKPSAIQDRSRIYDSWGAAPDLSAQDFFRVAWRRMAANHGERTFIPAIIPPGSTHVHSVSSLGFPRLPKRVLLQVAAVSAALISDFQVRVAMKGDIYGTTAGRLAFNSTFGLMNDLEIRAARLNCLTDAYADLWNDAFDSSWQSMTWAPHRDYLGKIELGDVDAEWSGRSPLRNALARRQALVEIDALVALMLGLTADELCTVYRTQFAVLYGYEKKNLYDAYGRLVPTSIAADYRKKGENLTEEERTYPRTEAECDAAEEATGHRPSRYTYHFPFQTNDREADMRAAYAFFEQKLEAMQ